MKKILALILALAMFAAMLAGCGEQTSGSNDSGKSGSQQGSQTDTANNPDASGSIPLYFDYVDSSIAVSAEPWYRGDITIYKTETTGMTKSTADDTIVLGGTANVEGADPRFVSQENQWSFNVYESLYQRNYETGEMEPWLATSMEYVGDDEIHITLREGVKFHDGNEMTAEDVFYTFQTIANNTRARAWSSMQNVDFENSTIVDDYHLILKTTSYITSYIDIFASGFCGIMSKDFLEKVGEDYNFMDGDAGTGPYYVTGMVADISMDFERFDDYWGGVPDGRVKFVQYKRYTDENVLYVDFMNGTVDMIYRIQPYDLTAILDGTTKDVIVYRVPNNRGKAIIFNQTPGCLTDDLNIRQAVAHAINYDESLIARYGGEGFADAQMTSIFMPGVTYKADIGTYEYDVELAKEYLAKAGYDTENRLTLKCATNKSANNDEFAEMMLGYLAEIGIDLDLDVMNSSTFKEVTQAGVESSEYDIVVASGAIADFGNGTPSTVLSSYLVGDRQSGEFNPLGAIYSDEVYELYLEAESTQDEAKAQENYTKIQQMFFDNVWKITLWADAQVCGAHPWIENTTFSAGQCIYWADWRITE